MQAEFGIKKPCYNRCRAALILDYTQKADEEKLYLYRGYKSLFDYLVKDLL
jgi:hypothetical protein